MTPSTLVIGGNCSIGGALIGKLADMGYAVVATTSKQGDVEALSRKWGVTFEYLDVQNSKSVDECFGRKSYDNVVYLASKHYLNSIRNFKIEKSIDCLSTNALGLMSVGKAYLRSISTLPRQQRSIVYVASLAAHQVEPGLLDYSISKALGIKIVKHLALELSSFGVKVNSVSPGWVESDRSEQMTQIVGVGRTDEIIKSYPLGIGSVSDVSDTIEFLISSRSKWMTGQDLIIDGGRCLK